MFTQLFAADGSEVSLRPAELYIEPGAGVDSYSVLEAARRRGETAIGYRVAADAHNSARAYGVRVNPTKTDQNTFADGNCRVTNRQPGERVVERSQEYGMTHASNTNRSLRLWRWIVVASAVVVVGGAALAGSLLLNDAWTRSRFDLVKEFANVPPDPDWPYLGDMVDRTATVCGAQVRCVQAVGNQYLTLLKFGSVEEAHNYAGTLGPNGGQLDPLVINFDGEPLGPRVRQAIVDDVARDNVTSPD